MYNVAQTDENMMDDQGSFQLLKSLGNEGHPVPIQYFNNSDSVQELIVVEDNKKTKDSTQANVDQTKPNTEAGASKAAGVENQGVKDSTDATGKFIQEKMIDIQINQLEEQLNNKSRERLNVDLL